jgi:PPOX class probable F420-dependent enzyme
MTHMSDFQMSKDAREAFLADVHVGTLAVERADGPPLASPVWYRYVPGGDVELMTEEQSLKGRLLRSAGRAALSVQRETFPYAYVTVDGPVTLGEPADGDLLDIATRYLGPDGGRAYVEGTPAGDNMLVRITPERWFSTDYSTLDLG